MAPNKDATEFNKIIQADRDKKKRQDLADKIFTRRSSAPAAGAIGSRKAPAGPSSLASRITKPGQPSKPSKAVNPLSRTQNAASLRRTTSTPQLGGNSRRNQALDAVVTGRQARTPNLNDQISIRTTGPSRNGGGGIARGGGGSVAGGAGFSIKGSASQSRDYVVIAQNFAQGTTAEDISSVFAPNPDATGLVSCRLLVSHPTIIAEITFDNQTTADDVVKTYNGKKADNRVLYVYHSDAPTQPRSSSTTTTNQHRSQGIASRIGGPVPIRDDFMEMDVPRPRYQEPYTPPRAQRAQPNIQDGRYGFADHNTYENQHQPRSEGGLVSDRLLGRQSRGNNRGEARLFH